MTQRLRTLSKGGNMLVEVYLNDINNEFIEDGCSHFWWQSKKNSELETLKPNPMDNLTIRNEQFGGLVYNMVTGIVYKLDNEAYSIIYDLKQGLNPLQVSRKYGLNKASIFYVVSSVIKW